jgi:hypothetical protein
MDSLRLTSHDVAARCHCSFGSVRGEEQRTDGGLIRMTDSQL